MNKIWITSIAVEGLHGQFSVDLSFKSGLNVIYGKNGRGKTTLLHILANILELDFERFRYLNFLSITVNTSYPSEIRIDRIDEGRILLRCDGEPLPLQEDYSVAQPVIRLLRAKLGSRSIYLPAFRSILERVRNETYAEQARTPESEAIRERERRELVPLAGRRTYLSSVNDTSAHTARKTVQCREWFGPFVPIVRYPSIREVTDRLASEYREAQIESGEAEGRMLSTAFVSVFRALVDSEAEITDSEVGHLLSRIRTALYSESGVSSGGAEFVSTLNGLIQSIQSERRVFGSSERNVLSMYASMLEERNRARDVAFSRVRQFEEAVNKFLDNKRLVIGSPAIWAARNSKEYREVFVESGDGRAFALTTLSSGERQVLTMLFAATRLSQSYGIFLVDEPELSLHVDWQRVILREIEAQAGGGQIIACTHSAEVGADHIFDVQLYEPRPFRQSPESQMNLLDDEL